MNIIYIENISFELMMKGSLLVKFSVLELDSFYLLIMKKLSILYFNKQYLIRE